MRDIHIYSKYISFASPDMGLDHTLCHCEMPGSRDSVKKRDLRAVQWHNKLILHPVALAFHMGTAHVLAARLLIQLSAYDL